MAAVVLLATQAGAHAETIYATTAGNCLVKFDSAAPGATVTNVVTGLAPAESVLGIDFRPATGELFALGSSSRSYTIDLAPNGGVLTWIGGLGVDTSELVGFDISGATGIAYASLFNMQSLASALYTINLSTGAATLVGDTGLRLTGLAVAPAPVPLPGAVWLLGSALAGLMIKRRR